MKIYIAGPITDTPDFEKAFAAAEEHLLREGHNIMNPAVLPPGFVHHEYMKVCFAMLDVCEAVVLLPGWERSVGAGMEFERATSKRMKIGYHEPDRKKVVWLK